MLRKKIRTFEITKRKRVLTQISDQRKRRSREKRFDLEKTERT